MERSLAPRWPELSIWGWVNSNNECRSANVSIAVRSHRKSHRRQNQPAVVRFQWELLTKGFMHLGSQRAMRSERQEWRFEIEQSSTLWKLAAMPLKQQPIPVQGLTFCNPHSQSGVSQRARIPLNAKYSNVNKQKKNIIWLYTACVASFKCLGDWHHVF